jgi:hypothetical protein
MIFPIVGAARYRNSYGRRQATHLHTGIDIAARKMTPIVAPFDGVLGVKRESFWIVGDNGYTVLGTHLNDDHWGRNDNRGDRDLMFSPIALPNARVRAGQHIGYVGNSGHTTGPHLHFELYDRGSGPSLKRIRNPFPSLKRSQRLARPRPWVPASEARPRAGEVRFVGCVRKPEVRQHRVTLNLVAKQDARGRVFARVGPDYLKVRLTPEAIEAAGGWSRIAATPREMLVSAYGRMGRTEFLASRIQFESSVSSE